MGREAHFAQQRLGVNEPKEQDREYRQAKQRPVPFCIYLGVRFAIAIVERVHAFLAYDGLFCVGFGSDARRRLSIISHFA